MEKKTEISVNGALRLFWKYLTKNELERERDVLYSMSKK